MPGADKAFHVLFQEHLEQGTRADDPSRIKWKHADFAERVGHDSKTVTNWKNGNRTPQKPDFDRICDLLFSTNPLHHAARAVFTAAWEKADAARGVPGRRSKPAPANGAPPQAAQQVAVWVPEKPFTLREGLGRVYVHQNQGETPGHVVALEVTVEAGHVYLTIDATDDTPKVDATFVVSAAEIVVVKDLNVTPVKGTTLGTADRPHPNVAFASSWRLKVPLASDGVPGGIILEGDTLRQYATREELPYGIRIELRCRDLDLKPVDEAALPGISEKQRAVLRRVLQKQDADPNSGVITLARAELCPRTDR